MVRDYPPGLAKPHSVITKATSNQRSPSYSSFVFDRGLLERLGKSKNARQRDGSDRSVVGSRNTGLQSDTPKRLGSLPRAWCRKERRFQRGCIVEPLGPCGVGPASVGFAGFVCTTCIAQLASNITSHKQATQVHKPGRHAIGVEIYPSVFGCRKVTGRDAYSLGPWRLQAEARGAKLTLK